MPRPPPLVTTVDARPLVPRPPAVPVEVLVPAVCAWPLTTWPGCQGLCARPRRGLMSARADRACLDAGAGRRDRLRLGRGRRGERQGRTQNEAGALQLHDWLLR